MSHKISVFVPTYNRLKKLKTMISSVETQCYSNWELIIIDDGSTDGSREYLKKFSDHDKIKIVFYNENRGHPVALLEANICEILTGDLVIFLGSDDYFPFDNIFTSIVTDFKNESHMVWKIGYMWKEEGKINEIPRQFLRAPESRSHFSHEVLLGSYIDSDYLFVYRKVYWDKFKQYFTEPFRWFSSFYDVALNYQYVELIKRKFYSVAGWGGDNITKGKNSEMYFQWSLEYRRYVLERYSKLMGVEQILYFRKSLILGLSIKACNSKEILKNSFVMLRDAMRFLSVSMLGLLLAIFPFRKLLFNLKRFVFSIRKKR